MAYQMEVRSVAWLFLTGVLGAQQHVSSASQNTAYVFDCGGHFLQLDTENGRIVATGSVDGIPTARGRDGCLVDSVRIEAETGLIYAVVPTTAAVDVEGERYYSVVALRQPDLRVVSRHDIPYSLDQVPNLMLDRPRGRLLVHCGLTGERPNGPRRNRVEELAMPSLKIPESATTVPAGANWLSDLGDISSTARLDTNGLIIDGDRIIDPNRPGSIRVNGYDLLTPVVRQQFASLQRPGATGKRYLDIVFAGSARDRMLFVVAWDTRSNQSLAGGGLLVYDINSQKVLSTTVTAYRNAPFDGTPGTPTVHLTPSGKWAIVEGYEWRIPEVNDGVASTQERLKTGEIGVYDASSGRFLRRIVLDPVPGYSGRVVGFSALRELMYYASAENIHIVDLKNGQSRAIPISTGFVTTAVLDAN